MSLKKQLWWIAQLFVYLIKGFNFRTNLSKLKIKHSELYDRFAKGTNLVGFNIVFICTLENLKYLLCDILRSSLTCLHLAKSQQETACLKQAKELFSAHLSQYVMGSLPSFSKNNSLRV